MLNLFLFLFIFNKNIGAAFGPKVFQGTYFEVERVIMENTLNRTFHKAEPHVPNDVIEKVLNDNDGLVGDQFKIPPYFRTSTTFWFKIYTQYSSNQVLIHDKNNLKLIYNIIDFSSLKSANINKFATERLQTSLTEQYIERIRSILIKLSNNHVVNDEEANELQKIIFNNYKKPRDKKAIKKFFSDLANNIRSQTGQRDMIYKGIVNALPYKQFIYDQFDNFKIPRELLAIPFLESSFNPHASSKVAAVGAWQLMPFIANKMLPQHKKPIEYRSNVPIASITAIHLLKENYNILKRWDLAVTAYNSGVKHLLLAKKKFQFKKSNLDLAFILENYNHEHLGFASQNFYSEFLALVHTLAYQRALFPTSGMSVANASFETSNLSFYLSLCPFTGEQFYQQFDSGDVRSYAVLNSHIENNTSKLERGVIVTSYKELNKKLFYKLSNQEIKRSYPSKWSVFTRKLSCKF